MARTTIARIQGVLGTNYDGSTSLTPYLDSATSIVDRLVELAGEKGLTITSTQAELVERWLGAYYYTVMDPLYLEKETGKAKGKWAERSYRDMAEQLDPTGLLCKILAKKLIEVTWLGKTPSEQTDYEERS